MFVRPVSRSPRHVLDTIRVVLSSLVARPVRAFRPVVVALVLSTAACADSITAPILLDPAVADRVLDAVVDARVRLAPVLENVGVRQRVIFDLQGLEDALTSRDAQRARYHTRLAANILVDYRIGLGSVAQDGPDVTAIGLALHAAAKAVGSDFDVSAFK